MYYSLAFLFFSLGSFEAFFWVVTFLLLCIMEVWTLCCIRLYMYCFAFYGWFFSWMFLICFIYNYVFFFWVYFFSSCLFWFLMCTLPPSGVLFFFVIFFSDVQKHTFGGLCFFFLSGCEISLLIIFVLF